ncbi:MAG: PadR family transcriptional regulator [Lachnospiraceae bacterium]|nr:PadR family transcriptional regulator [Lachnospiraceae bacterium]
MEDTQLMKGILEGCVLSVIARGETYGYEILSELERYGFDEIGEGTLYPILTRLDKGDCILCRRAKSPLGPVRKYYSITDRGRERLDSFIRNYQKVVRSANAVLFPQEGVQPDMPACPADAYHKGGTDLRMKRESEVPE